MPDQQEHTAVIFNFHHYIRIANAVDRTVLHIVVELDVYIIPLNLSLDWLLQSYRFSRVLIKGNLCLQMILTMKFQKKGIPMRAWYLIKLTRRK